MFKLCFRALLIRTLSKYEIHCYLGTQWPYQEPSDYNKDINIKQNKERLISNCYY